MQSRKVKSNDLKSYHFFLEFTQSQDPTITNSEDLLDWMNNKYSEATYQDYLTLRKLSAQHGYKTAFDLPITEDEFKYRNLLKQFSQWNVRNQSTCVDASSLLDWLFMQQANTFLPYHEFISLAQLGANKGLVTAINIPISEVEYNLKYSEIKNIKSGQTKQAIHEFKLMTDKIKQNYFNKSNHPKWSRADLIELLNGIDDCESIKNLSANQIYDIANGISVFCKKLSKSELDQAIYLGNYTEKSHSFLFPFIESQMGLNYDEKYDEQYVFAFKNHIKSTLNHKEGLTLAHTNALLIKIDLTLTNSDAAYNKNAKQIAANCPSLINYSFFKVNNHNTDKYEINKKSGLYS